MKEGEEDFEVQAILNHSPAYKTRSDTNTRYLLQSKGYGPACNSWEPASTLKRNAPDMLSDLKLQCKQLSLEMALTLGWPLVIETTLLPQAEVLVVAKATVEVEVAVEAEVSDLSARGLD
ncbi:hypothetical protein ABBQ38_011110 [Trebouxia sp. C0009 RCD-2024]